MMPRLRRILLEYRQDLVSQSIKQDAHDLSGWLFPSRQSKLGHLGRAQAHNILFKTFKELKLEGVSTHSMRRTMLMSLSRAGVALRTVKDISGYTNIARLQSYIDSEAGDHQRALRLIKY